MSGSPMTASKALMLTSLALVEGLIEHRVSLLHSQKACERFHSILPCLTWAAVMAALELHIAGEVTAEQRAEVRRITDAVPSIKMFVKETIPVFQAEIESQKLFSN